MSVFGSGTPAAREHAIIEAFDSPDYTFKYAGVNRDSGQKMRFELMRNIKSFRHGELEALRFAYLAYNRGLLDEEKFHWYRVSAIYGGGATDPSDWKFLGLFSFLRTARGAIEQARAAVASFVQANGGTDVEGQALAMVTKLAHDHPNDDLFRDMRRRFVDGVYWLTKGEMKRSAFAPSASPFGVELRYARWQRRRSRLCRRRIDHDGGPSAVRQDAVQRLSKPPALAWSGGRARRQG